MAGGDCPGGVDAHEGVASAPSGSCAVRFDGAGLDGAGLDGAGLDGAGLNGAGLDGVGVGVAVRSPASPGRPHGVRLSNGDCGRVPRGLAARAAPGLRDGSTPEMPLGDVGAPETPAPATGMPPVPATGMPPVPAVGVPTSGVLGAGWLGSRTGSPGRPAPSAGVTVRARFIPPTAAVSASSGLSVGDGMVIGPVGAPSTRPRGTVTSATVPAVCDRAPSRTASPPR